jgi:hypothetical protein
MGGLAIAGDADLGSWLGLAGEGKFHVEFSFL